MKINKSLVFEVVSNLKVFKVFLRSVIIFFVVYKNYVWFFWVENWCKVVGFRKKEGLRINILVIFYRVIWEWFLNKLIKEFI